MPVGCGSACVFEYVLHDHCVRLRMTLLTPALTDVGGASDEPIPSSGSRLVRGSVHVVTSGPVGVDKSRVVFEVNDAFF